MTDRQSTHGDLLAAIEAQEPEANDLKIDTGGGNVLDCIQVVEDVVMRYGDEIDAVCWQRIRAYFNPDRERVARGKGPMR